MSTNRCGACIFAGKECPPDCPFAPYFQADQPEIYGDHVLQLKHKLIDVQQQLHVANSHLAQIRVQPNRNRPMAMGSTTIMNIENVGRELVEIEFLNYKRYFPSAAAINTAEADIQSSDTDDDDDDSQSSEGTRNGEDLFADVSKAVDELYNTRDTYFPINPDEKTSKLAAESNLALQLLDGIPPEKRKTRLVRATYEYLRGKVLDVFPEYKKEAEDHLSKAVKLNPSLADAWLSLGNCIWKKDDLDSAKNCFTLGLSKGPNKAILCQLSMLERKMAQGAEDKVTVVGESIKHAKEAITLDVKDGNSWYNLGNAYLTSFFVTGAWDHEKLLHSLKAYQHAEKDERMMSNPDLHYNCATVNKYLENYERALSGFEAAALRDPGLNATEEVQKIVHLLDKIGNLVRGQKVKRLASLASSLASVNLNPSYRRESIDRLLGGLNRGVAVVGKVIFFVKHDNVTPFYYLMCDSSLICYVMSVYGIKNEAIKEGDQVTLLEPSYRYVDISWKGKEYQFKSVRVEFLEQVLVNGKTLTRQHAVQTSIYAQNKT